MKKVLFKEAHEQISVGLDHVGIHGNSLGLGVMLGIEGEVFVRMNWVSGIRCEEEYWLRKSSTVTRP